MIGQAQEQAVSRDNLEAFSLRCITSSSAMSKWFEEVQQRVEECKGDTDKLANVFIKFS